MFVRQVTLKCCLDFVMNTAGAAVLLL